MKYVKKLSEVESITLNELYKNHIIHRLRQRSHIILMSDNGVEIKTISIVTGLDRDTISMLMDRWDSVGIIGLYDGERSGRPRIFDAENEAKIIKKIENEPRILKQVTAEINEETEKNASSATVKRILKKHKKVWKRMKKTLAKKADPEKVKKAEIEISELQNKDKNGEIELYYFDEAGFSLTPSVPYGWQNIGENVELPSAYSPRINVTGLLNPTKQELVSWTFQGIIDSDVVISVFDDFAQNLTKKTWIILDNAPFHCSEKIMEKIEYWGKNNLFLYYLPPYSPQLNRIERLWKFMKYYWMPLNAYCSFEKLKSAVNDLLSGYGKQHLITFV
jgi:transposase